MIKKRISAAIAVAVCVIAFSQANAAPAAAGLERMEEQLQQLLRRFPEADSNKDGNLTVDEYREFRGQTDSGGASPSRSATAPTNVATHAQPATVATPSAAGPDGRECLYLLNTGPAVRLETVKVDGETALSDMRLDIESAFADASSSIQTFTGARALHDVALEPWSLTLAILPPRAGGKP